MCNNCNCDPCWMCGKRPKRLKISGGVGCAAHFDGNYDVGQYEQSWRDEVYWDHLPYAHNRCGAEWRWKAETTDVPVGGGPPKGNDIVGPFVTRCQRGTDPNLGTYVSYIESHNFQLIVGSHSPGETSWASDVGNRKIRLFTLTRYRVHTATTFHFVDRSETYRGTLPETCRSYVGDFRLSLALADISYNSWPSGFPDGVAHIAPPEANYDTPLFTVDAEFV